MISIRALRFPQITEVDRWAGGSLRTQGCLGPSSCSPIEASVQCAEGFLGLIYHALHLKGNKDNNDNNGTYVDQIALFMDLMLF